MSEAGMSEDGMSEDGPNWRLSFRVHHPSADLSALAERIGDAFDMDPTAVWRAGAPYPNARPPGQVRDRSYCTIPWPNDRGTVATALAEALAALGPLREELAGLVAAGARLDFFVGLFVESMMGAVLPPGLLGRMAGMGIELQLDIYGGPRGGPMGADLLVLRHSPVAGGREADDAEGGAVMGFYRDAWAVSDAIARLREQPGFCDWPDGFASDLQWLDAMAWPDGFGDGDVPPGHGPPLAPPVFARGAIRPGMALYRATHRRGGGAPDTKGLGVFSSPARAAAAIAWARGLPGFCDWPDGFAVEVWRLDADGGPEGMASPQAHAP